MKRTVVTLCCLGAALAIGAYAQDQAEFSAWMKTTGGTIGKLRKEIDAKAYSAVATDAATLQEVFKHVEDYFAKTNTDDAVKMAQASRSASKKLADAAAMSDADATAASLKALQGSCGGCHMAHREKLPEGGYKIK
jgi:cytochrome c556